MLRIPSARYRCVISPALLLFVVTGCGDAAGGSGPADQAGGAQSTGTGGAIATTGGAASGGDGLTGGAGPATTGGQSATGGTGGNPSGGGANQPTVVNPCDAMPAPGTWERIDPPGDVGDAQRVLVHPYESGTVFVNMHKGGNGAHYATDGLYKSTDCGATWSDLISTGENADLVNSGSWWSFIVDPTDDDIIYTIDGYGAGGVWKSTNGGVDWLQTIGDDVEQYVPGLFFGGLTMNPNDHLHLMATVHTNCSGPMAGNCLPETTDGGQTWHLLKGPGDGWSEGQGPMILDDDTILVGMSFGGLWLSTDHADSWTQVEDGGFAHIYRSPGGTYYVPGLWGVLKSDDGLSWSKIDGGQRTASIAGGSTTFFAADQWSRSYFSAPAEGATELTPFTLNGMPTDDGAGAPYLSYDDDHHILYSANFGGGLWRIVTE